MDAKVMKEMLENTGGLRSEFTDVSVHYAGKTYSATFSFRPILVLVSLQGRHAIISDGMTSAYSCEGSITWILRDISWDSTGISFGIVSDANTMAYFWGIG